MVPESLLLSFLNGATSTLLGLNGKEALYDSSHSLADDPLSCSRRYILSIQHDILEETLRVYRKDNADSIDAAAITSSQFRESLGKLGNKPNLSVELQSAMDGMNEAARLALCKLVLYWEHSLVAMSDDTQQHQVTSMNISRHLQFSPSKDGIDRTRLLEYMGLCQTALKLHCFRTFMAHGGRLFDDLPAPSSVEHPNMEDTELAFPQTRLEYVQQLLAKSMGWEPTFLTKELEKIFVNRDESYSLVNDEKVSQVFHELVVQMETSIRAASLEMKQKQEIQLLSDLDSGGHTRVVSVQYSEFEMTSDGRKVDEGSTIPPRKSTMEMQRELSEEDKKKQIRLANQAAMLQQEILGELMCIPEHERNNRLKEAERVTHEFLKEVMALPPGKERIDFLQSADPHTSKQLAIHKLWKGMVEANGGNPPKFASPCSP